MALVSQCKCQHPKLVHNRYTGKDVFVSCRKCLSCRRAYQAAWASKLQNEAKCHLYTYVIHLDYDERHLPKYDFSSDGDSLIEITPRLDNYYKKYPHLKTIKFNDLKFDTDADRDYFIDRINSHYTCIPHASVYDIQLFKKRLNTLVKRQVTGRYGSFRSAIVSELGGDTSDLTIMVSYTLMTKDSKRNFLALFMRLGKMQLEIPLDILSLKKTEVRLLPIFRNTCLSLLIFLHFMNTLHSVTSSSRLENQLLEVCSNLRRKYARYSLLHLLGALNLKSREMSGVLRFFPSDKILKVAYSPSVMLTTRSLVLIALHYINSTEMEK